MNVLNVLNVLINMKQYNIRISYKYRINNYL